MRNGRVSWKIFWRRGEYWNESFEILARAKVIPQELADKLKGMVGFRNIMVHQYQEMDIKIMVDVIEHHLDDLPDLPALQDLGKLESLI